MRWMNYQGCDSRSTPLDYSTFLSKHQISAIRMSFIILKKIFRWRNSYHHFAQHFTYFCKREILFDHFYNLVNKVAFRLSYFNSIFRWRNSFLHNALYSSQVKFDVEYKGSFANSLCIQIVFFQQHFQVKKFFSSRCTSFSKSN